MLARLEGQGYILLGSDYFNMGLSNAQEGYMVKGGHQRRLLRDIPQSLRKRPLNAADIPTDLPRLIRADYFNPPFFAAPAYGKLVAATQA
jgi:hypothetical protein